MYPIPIPNTANTAQGTGTGTGGPGGPGNSNQAKYSNQQQQQQQQQQNKQQNPQAQNRHYSGNQSFNTQQQQQQQQQQSVPKLPLINQSPISNQSVTNGNRSSNNAAIPLNTQQQPNSAVSNKSTAINRSNSGNTSSNNSNKSHFNGNNNNNNNRNTTSSPINNNNNNSIDQYDSNDIDISRPNDLLDLYNDHLWDLLTNPPSANPNTLITSTDNNNNDPINSDNNIYSDWTLAMLNNRLRLTSQDEQPQFRLLSNQVQSLDKSLLCSSCNRLLYQPHYSSICLTNHPNQYMPYCYECIPVNQIQCPNSACIGQPLIRDSFIPVLTILESAIYKLRVQCIYCKSLCPLQSRSLAPLAEHYLFHCDCICPYSGCNTKVSLAQLQAHKSICSKAIVYCPLAAECLKDPNMPFKCAWSGNSNDLQHHMTGEKCDSILATARYFRNRSMGLNTGTGTGIGIGSITSHGIDTSEPMILSLPASTPAVGPVPAPAPGPAPTSASAQSHSSKSSASSVTSNTSQSKQKSPKLNPAQPPKQQQQQQQQQPNKQSTPNSTVSNDKRLSISPAPSTASSTAVSVTTPTHSQSINRAISPASSSSSSQHQQHAPITSPASSSTGSSSTAPAASVAVSAQRKSPQPPISATKQNNIPVITITSSATTPAGSAANTPLPPPIGSGSNNNRNLTVTTTTPNPLSRSRSPAVFQSPAPVTIPRSSPTASTPATQPSSEVNSPVGSTITTASTSSASVSEVSNLATVNYHAQIHSYEVKIVRLKSHIGPFTLYVHTNDLMDPIGLPKKKREHSFNMVPSNLIVTAQISRTRRGEFASIAGVECWLKYWWEFFNETAEEKLYAQWLSGTLLPSMKEYANKYSTSGTINSILSDSAAAAVLTSAANTAVSTPIGIEDSDISNPSTPKALIKRRRSGLASINNSNNSNISDKRNKSTVNTPNSTINNSSNSTSLNNLIGRISDHLDQIFRSGSAAAGSGINNQRHDIIGLDSIDLQQYLSESLGIKLTELNDSIINKAIQSSNHYVLQQKPTGPGPVITTNSSNSVSKDNNKLSSQSPAVIAFRRGTLNEDVLVARALDKLASVGL